MKNINQYIAEHMFSGKKVTISSQNKKQIKDPEEGTTAYDINGTEFDIVSVFYVPDIKTEADYKDILDDYDYYGSFVDEFKKLSDIQEYKFIVACTIDSFGHTALFVWGTEGLCYEYE